MFHIFAITRKNNLMLTYLESLHLPVGIKFKILKNLL